MRWSSNVFLCSILCVLPTNAKECSLYENFRDSRCFVGDELTSSLTWSSTVWAVEFYSSWCGHCQHFAPTWKEVATRIKGWSSVVRMGQIDCSQSENSHVCRKFRIMAYPSIKFIPALTNNPTSSELQDFIGTRSVKSVMEFIISYVLKTNVMPSLVPIQSANVEENILCLVFERRESFLGMKIMLDLLSEKEIRIRRVIDNNTALVKKYSVLYFPSLVFLLPEDKYLIISGKSAGSEDIHSYFQGKLRQIVGSHFITGQQSNGGSRPNSINISPHIKNSVYHTRPTDGDLRSAVSYSFRMEVQMHHLISDESFAVLLKFVSHLEKTFQFSHSSIAASMRAIRTKLESKALAGFILASEWERLLESKLSTDLFPIDPQWSSCAGSLPQYRGYPCGLWSLMHAVTVLSLSLPGSIEYRPLSLRISSRESLYGMVDFIKHFFSCEECRKHFMKLSVNLRSHPISYDGDAVLWLWEAHNVVNKRLKNADSTDPTHPKVIFPPYQLCPDCYVQLSNKSLISKVVPEPSLDNVGFVQGESMLQLDSVPSPIYYWNKSAVFLFLTNFYGMGHLDEIPSTALLSAAWPRKYPISADHHYAFKVQTSYTYSNSAIFFVQFMACVLLMAFLISFSLRYKALWRSSRASLTRYKML